MTAPIWITPAGFLGTFTERANMSVNISATGTGISYQIISGSLPSGTRINTSTGVISGLPISVSANTISTFVVRATNTSGIKDRTFSISIAGPTDPIWVTSEGFLPVGINGELFAFNKMVVDYRLQADIDILPKGKEITYYIGNKGGNLPPGLTLTPTGRIHGYIDDLLKIDNDISLTGGYDLTGYDRYPYDHGTVVENVVELSKPRSINKIYQFTVNATNGISTSQRNFKIQVFDPDTFRADNSFIYADSSTINASASFLIAPLWQNQYRELLPTIYNLGSVRASKSQVLSLYEYDPYPNVGARSWTWNLNVNPEITLYADNQLDAQGNSTRNQLGSLTIHVKNSPILPVKGMKICLGESIDFFDNTVYEIVSSEKTGIDSGIIYINRPLTQSLIDNIKFYSGSLSNKPPGLSIDTSTGEIYGKIPYQPAYSATYKFTVRVIKTESQSNSTAYRDQIFLLTVKGNVDSEISFISSSSLGTIVPGEISELAILANNNSKNDVSFEISSGRLPPGLTLNLDGTIEGKISYGSKTRFDSNQTTFDNGSTTIDKNRKFTVKARDSYQLNAVEKEFSLTIGEEYPGEYTRIYLKPFLTPQIKSQFVNFITDQNIFVPDKLYRQKDKSFGVQTDLKMLLETNLEKVELEKYAEAMQSFYRKKLYIGNLKVARAEDSLRNPLYDLIYLEIIDDQIIDKTSPDYSISIKNMQRDLENIIKDDNLLISVDDRLRPKFMNTIQPDSGAQLGYIMYLPLCYALPNESDRIINNIKTSSFDFKSINFEVDRIIIENSKESNSTEWLFFPTSRR